MKANATAVMFGALAAAPLMAPAVLGSAVAGEVAVAAEARIAEAATVVETEPGEIGIEPGVEVGEGPW